MAEVMSSAAEGIGPLRTNRNAPTADALEAKVAEPVGDDLWVELAEALVAYGNLIEEYKAGSMDDPTFFRRAFRIGLIVRDRDAWMLDLTTERWWRYDGLQLSTLGIQDAEDSRAE
jgi:hypothetical protein